MTHKEILERIDKKEIFTEQELAEIQKLTIENLQRAIRSLEVAMTSLIKLDFEVNKEKKSRYFALDWSMGNDPLSQIQVNYFYNQPIEVEKVKTTHQVDEYKWMPIIQIESETKDIPKLEKESENT